MGGGSDFRGSQSGRGGASRRVHNKGKGRARTTSHRTPTRGVAEALISRRGTRPAVQHAIANVSTHLRSSGRAVTGVFVCGMFVGAPSLTFFFIVIPMR